MPCRPHQNELYLGGVKAGHHTKGGCMILLILDIQSSC